MMAFLFFFLCVCVCVSVFYNQTIKIKMLVGMGEDQEANDVHAMLIDTFTGEHKPLAEHR